jgi:polyisoprenoid-binding protein YceI
MKCGPENASLHVHTYREGVAAKVGHDLVIEVTRWEATIGEGSIELTADPVSLEVREGHRGVKPLSDKDRREIVKNIDAKVLGREQIVFRSTSVDGGAVTGELTMAGTTRPVTARLDTAAGRTRTTIPLVQSEWGIKPYRGLMGALKVRDDVEIVIDAPAA